MATPHEFYTKRVRRFTNLSMYQGKHANLISNLRLITAVVGIGLAGFFFGRSPLASTGIIILALTLFIFLVGLHNKVLANKKLASTLVEINENSLKRLNGEWVSFPDTGEEFRDILHPYTLDLDIFGRGSLFQLINNTQTFIGRETLRSSLTEPICSKDMIFYRQEAIVELSGQAAWRQRLTAEGRVVAGKLNNPEPLFNWAGQTNKFYLQPLAKYVFSTIPIITLLLILGHFFLLHLPIWIPVLTLIGQFALLMLFGTTRTQVFKTIYKYEDSLKVYSNILRILETKNFSSPLLKELQAGLRDRTKKPAYLQVKKLSKLVDSLSNRNNAMFLAINILTLWDYQCMFALEQWKAESGRLLTRWLSAVGEVEALASLAVLKFDNPTWTLPIIEEKKPTFSAQGMGHPLLTKDRVLNDLKIDGTTRIGLITGSNMSGKSTLLRTVGINLILAYSGSPVCAEYLRCTIMKLYTCMRVSDNLEQNISSFYAELLRIKSIVQAAETEQQVFFLLDEIFKGTNSEDRHTGAKVLIKQLSGRGALGLVSTHDLELGELERESAGQIRNYHFREYYQDDEIKFDYKLRPGLSNTRNALYLIKMAGINIEL